MKILFTHGYFLNEDEKEKGIMKPYPPLGLLYVSAYLEKNSYPNQIFDSTFSSFEKLTNKLTSELPDVVAMYTNLMTKINVLKIIKFIKGEATLSHTKIILGGPELTHHAENFLLNGADLLIIGEGEETMLEVVNFFKENKTLPKKVSGTAVLNEEKKLNLNPSRALIKNIDELPLPNRKGIDLHLYLDTWKKHHSYSTLSVSTMRGCPYTCKWCSRAVYGGTYRRRSPKAVVEELIELKKNYSPEHIWFVDDVFTISHKWLSAFAEEVIKCNTIIPYEIISRADRLTEEVMQQLKASGCYRIWIGAESGSQKIIDAMDRRVEVKQVREMIQLAAKYKIETGTFIMLGYPGEGKNEIRETIDHLVLSNPDQFTLTVAYPIKGTPLYDEVENILIHRPQWDLSTDRELDFKRKHPRRFYELAIRWVNNEVSYRKEKNKTDSNLKNLVKFKVKSLLTESAMFFATMGN